MAKTNNSEISDLDIIKQIEKEIGIKLKKVKIEDFDNRMTKWKRRFYEDKYLKGYALNEAGRVIGLGLLGIKLKTPLWDLVSRLVFLKKASFVGIGLSNYSFLSTLTQLTSLDLSHNDLNDLSVLAALTQLKNLNLKNNKLSHLSGLAALTQLTYLDLSWNKLSDVSMLSSLAHLEYLDLEGNPLTIPPKEIAKNGIYAIRSYFRQMAEQGKARLYEARLLLVGEPGAGKTTLWKKILNPDYPVPNTEEEPTLGIKINSQWEFPYHRDKGIAFKTHIWDFGGQPIQYMLHQYFLTSRSLYVLVSDDREQRTRFDYWFDIIKVLGEKSPVLVVLNEKKHRSVSDFDYDKYKKRYGPIYEIERRDVDFAKKDGRLDALRYKITEMLSGLTHIGDELPKQWVTIRRELENIKEKNQIGINDYFDICRRRGIVREQDMLTLCGYLNALGAVLHYKDDRSLANTLFVNSYWVVDALYTAISDKTLEMSKGRFKKEWLFNLWEKKGYSNDECCKLLNLMLKDNFEICYRIDTGPGKDEEYMVPMLLPEVEPDYEEIPGSGAMKFRCQYPFMPEGIIARLTVRLHEDIEKHEGQDVIWKKGFILNRQGHRARVAEDRSEKGVQIIDIKISGAEGTRRDFLEVIRNEIRRIHQKSFKEIEMEEMVPCNCTQCRGAAPPHYFEYSVLQRFLEKNKNVIDCLVSTESVSIRGLIEAVDPGKEVGQDF